MLAYAKQDAHCSTAQRVRIANIYTFLHIRWRWASGSWRGLYTAALPVPWRLLRPLRRGRLGLPIQAEDTSDTACVWRWEVACPPDLLLSLQGAIHVHVELLHRRRRSRVLDSMRKHSFFF